MQKTLLLLSIIFYSLCTSADNSIDTKYRYLYIEAVRQQDMENYANAFELLRRCNELKPDAAETNFALSKFYITMNQDSLSLAHLERAVKADSLNTEFAERLAQMYLYNDRINEAIDVYEHLSKQQPAHLEYLDLLARIYEQRRDYSNLLDVLNRIELQDGAAEDITLSKMHVHNLMGNSEGAYNELKKLTDAHPNDMNLQVMMGNWLLGNGRKEEALATFTKVLKEEPSNAKGQMSLMDYYRSEGKTEEADHLLYEMLINPKTEPETRITLLRDVVQDSERNGGDSVRIMEILNRVLTLPQTTTEVAEIKVAYLTLKNAPKDSIRAGWERVLEISPEYVEARLNLIMLLWTDSIDENVIRECKKAIEYVPNNATLYYYLGIAQHINKQNKDAINTLHRGVACINEETPKETIANLYEILGDVLQKENRTTEAFAAYDSCLVYDPDKVICLNNYAYFLSCENRELKKAEKMSYRAITAEANNPIYLDTYAWILYQQKRYEEARIYIEQAISCDTLESYDSGDIYEHAGDIYYHLGSKEKAYELWQKALSMGVDNEALLRKKINKKKLIE